MLAPAIALLALATAAPTKPSRIEGRCLDASRAQLTADAGAIRDAQAALKRSGFAGIAAFEGRLQAMLDHAPAGAPPIEMCETRYVVHSSSLAEGIIAAGMAMSDQKKTGGKRSVTLEGPYPYATAALYLGSLATERRDYRRAAEVLRRGLVYEPQNALLASELSTALSQDHQNVEALAVADAALTGLLLEPKTKALLQRRRGFALTELRRLDEAEVAYRQALTFDPSDENARRELTYIAQQRAGAPQGAITTTAPARQDGAAPPRSDAVTIK